MPDTTSFARTAVILAVTIASNAAGQTPAKLNPAAPRPGELRFIDPRDQPQEMLLGNYKVPQRMTSREMERYARWMGLSEEERKRWDELTSECQRCSNQVWADHQERIYAATQATQESGRKLIMAQREGRTEDRDTIAREQHGRAVEAVKFRKQLNDAFRRCESSMFDTIQPILGDEGQFGLLRARWDRERAWGRYHGGGQVASGAEPYAILAHIQCDEETIEKLDPILLEYEKAVTPLYREKNDKWYDRELKSAMWLIQQGFGPDGTRLERGSPEMEAQNVIFRGEMDPLYASLRRANERIAEFNERFAAQLNNALEGPDREAFEAEFRRRAYGNVYRDFDSLFPMLKQLEAVEITDVERADAIAGYRKRYVEKYDAIAKEMIKRLRAERKRTSDHPFGFALNVSYSEGMKALQQQRLDLARETLDAIEKLLNPSERETLSRTLSDTRFQLDDARPGLW